MLPRFEGIHFRICRQKQSWERQMRKKINWKSNNSDHILDARKLIVIKFYLCVRQLEFFYQHLATWQITQAIYITFLSFTREFRKCMLVHSLKPLQLYFITSAFAYGNYCCARYEKSTDSSNRIKSSDFFDMYLKKCIYLLYRVIRQ